MIRASAKRIGLQSQTKGKGDNGKKGKGSGKLQSPPKGKDKSKDNSTVEQPMKRKGKEPNDSSKGKGQGHLPEATFQLTFDDWSFSKSASGVNPGAFGTLAQQLASKIKNDNVNISLIMPQPPAIEKKAPVEIKIRLHKTQGSYKDAVFLTGHLHVLAGIAPETVRKTTQTSTRASFFCRPWPETCGS